MPRTTSCRSRARRTPRGPRPGCASRAPGPRRPRPAGGAAAARGPGGGRASAAASVGGRGPGLVAACGGGEVQAGEGQRLGEVGLALGGGHRAAGVDLDDDMAVEAGAGEALQQLGAGLGAAARAPGARPWPSRLPSARWTWREPVAHPVDHGQGVGAGGRGVREVDGEVPVVVLGDVPVGGVREHLAVAVAPRVHVLDGEPDVRLVRHPPDPGDEVPGVLALPAERRVHDDGGRAELLGRRLGPLELDPRVGGPDPLGDQQAGRVHGEDRDLVVVARAGAGPRCPG